MQGEFHPRSHIATPQAGLEILRTPNQKLSRRFEQDSSMLLLINLQRSRHLKKRREHTWSVEDLAHVGTTLDDLCVEIAQFAL